MSCTYSVAVNPLSVAVESLVTACQIDVRGAVAAAVTALAAAAARTAVARRIAAHAVAIRAGRLTAETPRS